MSLPRLSFLFPSSVAVKLNLNSLKAWRKWCKSGERPYNMPVHPERAYVRRVCVCVCVCMCVYVCVRVCE